MKRREFLTGLSTVAVVGRLPEVADSADDWGHPSRWFWDETPPPLADGPNAQKLSVLFGQRLAVAIKRAGIDRGRLAHEAGLTPHGLDLVLRGRVNLDIVTADRLSDAVGVTLWKMIDRRAEPW